MTSPLAFVRRFFGLSGTTDDTLHIDYQPDVDLLFAWRGEPQPAKSVQVEPGVYVRVTPNRRVIGIEVLDFSGRFKVDRSGITSAFVEQILHRYAPAALSSIPTSR